MDLPLLTHFCYTRKQSLLRIFPKGFKLVFTDVILTIYFFSSIRMITWIIFQNSWILFISTCPFLWTQKDNTNFPFLMLKLFANTVNLQPQFIVKLLLVVCKVTKCFLSSVYKFSMVYNLVNRFFCICLEWAIPHENST